MKERTCKAYQVLLLYTQPEGREGAMSMALSAKIKSFYKLWKLDRDLKKVVVRYEELQQELSQKLAEGEMSEAEATAALIESQNDTTTFKTDLKFEPFVQELEATGGEYVAAYLDFWYAVLGEEGNESNQPDSEKSGVGGNPAPDSEGIIE